MKGYLKSTEGCFQLAPKVTTVGREGCDLVIQSAGVDFQHAVIEFSEQEDCFVLQDLNTQQGTYVNDCRVQNAAVRLAPSDIIRFGFGGTPYELQVETQSQVSYPPVHQRAAWTQPLTVITDPVPPQVYMHGDPGLPHLAGTTHTNQAWTASSGSQGHTVALRPPSMRSRPLSAGSQRRSGFDQVTVRGQFMSVNAGQAPMSPMQTTSQRSVTGWVGGRPASAAQHTTHQHTTQGYSADLMFIQEKEQKLLRLTEECRRLSTFETECARKEDMIQQLRHEIADLQSRLRHMETRENSYSTDEDVTQKILNLENEVQLKKTEVLSLREQVTQMKSQSSSAIEGTSLTRQEYNDRVQEINSLRTELDRCKKDKNLTAGLVTQMQRDMSNKDTTISRLTREIESLKKELGDKDVQIGSLQSKFQRTKDTKQRDEELESKEKELAVLKLKLKNSEKMVEDQTEVISSLKSEIERVRSGAAEAAEASKKLQKDLDTTKTRLRDMERVELQAQVDMKQVSDKSVRFRSRVLQVTYSTPGIKAPDKEITDDELLEQLKLLIDERTDLKRQAMDSKENLNMANAAKKEIIDNSKKLKQQLNESVARLEASWTVSRLQQEADLASLAAPVHDAVAWVTPAWRQLLLAAHASAVAMDTALNEAGVNTKISDDSAATHITALSEKWKASATELSELREKLNNADTQYKADLEVALTNLREELSNEKVDALEKVRLECDEKLNKAIDEIRELEAEKRGAAVDEQTAKTAQLEINIEQLKASILEKEAEYKQNQEDVKVAVEEIERYKALEIELREKISEYESSKTNESEIVSIEITKVQTKHEEEVQAFKEQIRQHSVTICTMEERLNKVVKKNKDYQTEMAHMRETITELQKKLHQKPSAPPKPKVQKAPPPAPVQIVAAPSGEVTVLEGLVSQLRLEIADANRFIKEQENTIIGLRKDLQGASARLTDMTGELSEAQKEEIERSRRLLQQQEAELLSLRQQMAKLSHLVDKKSAEIKELADELRKEKSALTASKNQCNQHASRIVELEEELRSEREAAKKSADLLETEGRITSEMTAIGAQCRGERHEQVIARQREALTELRARIKALEQARPPLPTSDQALQQVVLLKKELAELRACHAMSASSSAGLLSIEGSTLQDQVNRARGVEPVAAAEAEVERSAHRQTMEAMELSENSYLTLLRGVASALELDSVGGLRPMAHIPKDERQRLFSEREAAVELLTSRIKVLKERIQRKDELLQGYERDLAKLRQAESLATTKHAQLESLTGDIRSRTEETQYLRESLARLRSDLDKEKRLNAAIKSKKTFHLEHEHHSNGTFRTHKCPPEDIMGKQQAKKKAQSEKLRRKNYEIKTLKDELTGKEQHLQDSRRRVVTLETTMGLESQRDPFEPPSGN